MMALRKKIATAAALVAAAGVLATAAPANADSTATSANDCAVATARFVVEASKMPTYYRWIRGWEKKLAAATTERDRAYAREGLAKADAYRKEGEVRTYAAGRLVEQYCR